MIKAKFENIDLVRYYPISCSLKLIMGWMKKTIY